MRNKTHIWFTVGIILPVLVLAAGAQDEQRLQYRSSREARSILGGLFAQNLNVISERPEGIELPDFKEDESLFFRWSSPMAKNGYLFIALDRASEAGARDLLYIDSNGDGNLKDETTIEAYKAEKSHAYFGPVKVTFEAEDGPIVYHLNLRLCDHGKRWLYVSSGGWYEGTITVGQEKKYCMLIDYNANGTFNDKSLNSNESDRIRIGKEGAEYTRFIGNYVEIDDKLYRSGIARDGAYIKLTRAEDVTFGNIRLPESITEVSLGGENGQFTFKPENGTGSVPVGEYRIDHWSIERKDDTGNNWKAEGRGFSEKGLFNITEAEETELSIGEPIISTLDARDRSGTYSFSQNLKGKLGESIQITRNGKRTLPPKLRIKSEDGQYDRTYDFRYG